MGDVYQYAVWPLGLDRIPQRVANRRMEVNLWFIDNEQAIFRGTQRLPKKVESNPFAVAHFATQITQSSCPEWHCRLDFAVFK